MGLRAAGMEVSMRRMLSFQAWMSGAEAMAAKIRAKAGKYSMKRRDWKSRKPLRSMTNRLVAVATFMRRLWKPSASTPPMTANNARPEFSISWPVS